MSLLGRTISLSSSPVVSGAGAAFDTYLAADGDLYSAFRTSSGSTALLRFDNARGDGVFSATLPNSGESVALVGLGDLLGSVIARPGADFFAPSTLFLSIFDPDNAPFTDDVTLASGRITGVSTTETRSGFAVVYENSGLGRGDEILQFHDRAGALIRELNIGAQFESDIVALKGGKVVVLGSDADGSYLRRFNPDGSEIGSRKDVDGLGAVTALKNGGFAVASAGEDGRIQIQKFKVTGVKAGAAITVETDTPVTPAYDDGDLALTETSKGLLALSYTAQQVDFLDDTFLTMVNGRGEVVIDPVAVSPEGTGHQSNPDFTALNGNATLLAFHDAHFPQEVEGHVIDAPDTIRNGSGKSQTLSGKKGDDLISGLGGNDTLKGNNGSDTLHGGNGKDRLLGNSGNDRLDGGSGNDTLVGAGGGDMLFGGNNNDRLQGGAGNDTLDGGKGNDVEQGNAGRDTFWSNPGADTLLGGGGADTFLYHSDNFGKDVIRGFVGGVDILDFTAFDAADIKVIRAGDDVRIRLDNNDFVTVEDTTRAEVFDSLLLG